MVKSLKCEGYKNMNSTYKLKALNQTYSNCVNTQKHSYCPVRSGDDGQEDRNRGGQDWWFDVNAFMKVRVFSRSNSFANRQQDPKMFEMESGAGSSMLKDCLEITST